MHAQQNEWAALNLEQRRAWAGFLRAHAAITRVLDGELVARHALPLSSYDVLVQLQLSGGEMRMSRLAEAVVLSRSGLSRLIDRLEKQGLVSRRAGSRGRRQTFAHLTRRGTAKLAECTPLHLSGVRKLFLEKLSSEQAAELAVIWTGLLGFDPLDRPPSSVLDGQG